MKQRVVVTGMGVMTSLGSDLDTFWNNLMDRKVRRSHVEAFDVCEYTTEIAAEIKDFNPEDYISTRKKRAAWTVSCNLRVAASTLAIEGREA